MASRNCWRTSWDCWPTALSAEEAGRFDALFARRATGQRACARALKTSLLMVLVEIPLQTTRRTGRQRVGGDQFWAGSSNHWRAPSVPGWDHPEVGSELLPLHQRPNYPQLSIIEERKELNLGALPSLTKLKDIYAELRTSTVDTQQSSAHAAHFISATYRVTGQQNAGAHGKTCLCPIVVERDWRRGQV